MELVRMYNIGEEVNIPMVVVGKQFDEKGEQIKYQLKDKKTGKILDWFYSAKEIIPVKKANNIKTVRKEDRNGSKELNQ